MRRNGQKASLFSYAFPIIVALVLVFLFAKLLFSGGGSSGEIPATSSFLYVRPETSESSVLHQVGSRDPRVITEDEKLFSGERIIVDSGNARIVFPNSTSKLTLSEWGKLSYNWISANREQVILENQKLWIDAQSDDISIVFPNFDLYPSAWTVVSINKNELLTQIYVLRGSVEVQDVDTSASIDAGDQVSILKLKSLSDALKDVTSIKDDFIDSEWFVRNNGAVALAEWRSMNPSLLEEDTTIAGSTSQTTGGVLIEYPFDETSVSTDTINVTGRVVSSLVTDIRIWTISGAIDEQRNFSIPDVSLASGENNLVYRTYDADENMISKGFITVYKDGVTSSDTSTTQTFQVQNFPLEKTGYTIVSPIENPYSTSEDLVRIDGAVPVGVVSYITINDYRLSKFPSGWANWYYFANTQFGNLKEWVNIYVIRYYDESDIEIHSQIFTIRQLPANLSSEANI